MIHRAKNRKPFSDLLSKLTKEDLIERILFLSNKREQQARVLRELKIVLVKRKKKILQYEVLLMKPNTDTNQKKIITHYEDLIRNYRLEIRDLKNEIEIWKIRFMDK